MGANGVGFGNHNGQIHSIAKGIKTFTEAVDDSVVHLAKRVIEQADTVVFLGFGFLEQNMTLITPDGYAQAKHVHATTYGISQSDRGVIFNSLRNIIADNAAGRMDLDNLTNENYIDVNNGTCGELLMNNRFRLMQE